MLGNQTDDNGLSRGLRTESEITEVQGGHPAAHAPIQQSSGALERDGGHCAPIVLPPTPTPLPAKFI